MLSFYKSHFFFFLHKHMHMRMHSRKRLCRGVTVEYICQFVRARVVLGRDDYAAKRPRNENVIYVTSQYCTIGTGQSNSDCQQQYGCGHREKNHAVSLSSMRFCLDFVGIEFEIRRKQMQYWITML